MLIITKNTEDTKFTIIILIMIFPWIIQFWKFLLLLLSIPDIALKIFNIRCTDEMR